MNVLIVAAHPDDEVLGVGGTAACHARAGDSVTALVVADCLSARDGGAVCLPDASAEAARILGVTVRFLGLPGMTLARMADMDLNRPIEQAIRDLRPGVVYTHHRGDPNSDHRAVAAATMVASRPIGSDCPRRVLCFETPSSTEWGWGPPFLPTVFVDVSETLDLKLAAMAAYAAELRPSPHPRNLDSLRSRAAYWGQVAGVRYAEPFMLIREVVR